MATIFAYFLTILCVLLGLTSIPQSLIGGLVSRFSNLLLGAFLGSVVTWLALNFLWIKFEGSPLSVLAIVLSLGTIFMHGNLSSKELNQNAKTLMAAEMWGILVVGIYVLAKFGIRWY